MPRAVQTFRSGINGELTLHGQQGSDLYEIGLAGEISSRINVFDQSRRPGINRLRIYGTNEADFFLLRANKDLGLGMVAAIEVDANRLPVAGGVIERINYDADISGAVEIFGRNGNDTFVLDDNLAPTTIFGDAGNDTFQAGQVYQSFRDARNPDNGLAEEDYFETTQITRGFLSNGVSQSTVLFGGTGNDTFTVYSNKAELFLFGDEDDDTFTVRAFVKVDPNDPKAPYTNINGGQGADFVAFTVNAPVRIDGGDGFDTLTVIGTEFGDDFVVNDQGVYGAGLFVSYTGLEKIVVDALEGNDRFFIESTSAARGAGGGRRPGQRYLQCRRQQRQGGHGGQQQPGGPQRPGDPVHHHRRPGLQERVRQGRGCRRARQRRGRGGRAGQHRADARLRGTVPASMRSSSTATRWC
jgi:hypothetical protein